MIGVLFSVNVKKNQKNVEVMNILVILFSTLGGMVNTAVGGTTTLSTAGNVMFSSTLATSTQVATNTATITLSNTVGNSMSNTAIQGGSLGDILKSGSDTLTDIDTLKTVAVSGLGAGLTLGLTQNIDFNKGNQVVNAIKESAVSTVSSTAIQSVINGDSFSETLKEQGINTLVGAISNLGAKQIGMNYHTGNIGKATQLTLHAGLGALTSGLTGNDALSGAVSGVMGEVVGELYAKSAYGKTYNFTQQEKNTLKEIGGLSGAVSSLIVGKAQGLDNEEIVDNIFTGQRLGKNAVENNFLYKDIVDATLEYRDFKKTITGNNIGYEDEDYEDTVIIPQEVEERIYIGEKAGEVLDKLPEVDIMDVNIDASFSFKDGLIVGMGMTVLNISNKAKTINTAIGDLGGSVVINEEGVNASINADLVKVTTTNGHINAEISYGTGFDISTQGKMDFHAGVGYDVNISE